MNIKIFGSETCAQCKQLLSFSIARKLNYQYLVVPIDISLEDARKEVGSNFSSFPQILISYNDEIIHIDKFQSFMQFINKSK
jgi:glutaredoxin